MIQSTLIEKQTKVLLERQKKFYRSARSQVFSTKRDWLPGIAIVVHRNENIGHRRLVDHTSSPGWLSFSSWLQGSNVIRSIFTAAFLRFTEYIFSIKTYIRKVKWSSSYCKNGCVGAIVAVRNDSADLVSGT
jgi:hypothetical protein